MDVAIPRLKVGNGMRLYSTEEQLWVMGLHSFVYSHYTMSIDFVYKKL